MSSTVIIADDHPVVVAGVETILKAHRYDVVARAHDTDTLFDALSDHPCDVVVTDYSMPEGNQPDGMPMIRRIRATRPDIGIVVLTMLSNPAILRSLLDMGVAAIFDKRTNLRDIPVAVHAADVGRSYLSPAIRRLFHEADCANGHDDLATRLSPREVEVLRAYAQGHGLGGHRGADGPQLQDHQPAEALGHGQAGPRQRRPALPISCRRPRRHAR